VNNKTVYKPTYENSWALVIGINNYQTAPPLGYARQDAEAIYEVLVSRFGFPKENVTILTDQSASREGILKSFLLFSNGSIAPDDRIIVFFAGHGFTRTGWRGEVGFLVPVDGNPGDLATLLRWDDLTRNAELIDAKHMFFVMDACYGGLAVQRTVPSGSSRFLKDMLQRYTRQVLTAGKGDETVADSGGPRPNHSIFTGHLLDALEGKAADPTGTLTANAVMAYVYEHVSNDPHSQQSPHFGFFEGDGDFIFSFPNSDTLSKNTEEEGNDILIQVPAGAFPATNSENEHSLTELVKGYLAEPRDRIRLDDFVARETRSTLHSIRTEEFPTQTAMLTAEDFAQRIRKYETVLSRMRAITILIAKWGGTEHQPMLERIIARLADSVESQGGMTVWLGLRWYPIMLLMYTGGIAAISAGNYMSLSTLLTTKVKDRTAGGEPQDAVVPTIDGMIDVDRADLFKSLPGYERNYVPRSEYLFKMLQPEIEDLLFLGNSYEESFDRFEIFYALVRTDNYMRKNGWVWGPPGRFGWKFQRGTTGNPFAEICSEADQHGGNWLPLTSGLFAGSIDRFKEVSTSYREQVLTKLSWF
jgi:hypothetical protein